MSLESNWRRIMIVQYDEFREQLEENHEFWNLNQTIEKFED